MTTRETIAPLQRSVEVPLAPDHAFTRFTEKMGVWWPAAYTWSGEGLEGIGIEPGGAAPPGSRPAASCSPG